jgi:hypothetical protein
LRPFLYRSTTPRTSASTLCTPAGWTPPPCGQPCQASTTGEPAAGRPGRHGVGRPRKSLLGQFQHDDAGAPESCLLPASTDRCSNLRLTHRLSQIGACVSSETNSSECGLRQVWLSSWEGWLSRLDRASELTLLSQVQEPPANARRRSRHHCVVSLCPQGDVGLGRVLL